MCAPIHEFFKKLTRASKGDYFSEKLTRSFNSKNFIFHQNFDKKTIKNDIFILL